MSLAYLFFPFKSGVEMISEMQRNGNDFMLLNGWWQRSSNAKNEGKADLFVRLCEGISV
jgi:hypothetical protein